MGKKEKMERINRLLVKIAFFTAGFTLQWFILVLAIWIWMWHQNNSDIKTLRHGLSRMYAAFYDATGVEGMVIESKDVDMYKKD